MEGLRHPLPAPLIELIAQRFRLLSEPTRIKLLDVLREGPANVQQLTEATGSTQQNVSKHLGLLHRAGVLERRKRGTSVVYAQEAARAGIELRALRARVDVDVDMRRAPSTRRSSGMYGLTDRKGSRTGLLNTPDGFDLLAPNNRTPTHPQTG